MEFPEIEKKKKNEENYDYENLRIARDFSKMLIKEISSLVKSIVIFGSQASKNSNKNSDIDLLVIIDNTSVIITDELKEAYYAIVNEIIEEVSNRLHITTMNLTDFWDLNRKGDPVIINILRTGYPLYDESLFEPAQILLELGKIRPTRETIFNYQYRAENLIDNNYKYLENGLKDLFYGVIDLAHCCLILNKILPESPKKIGERFKKAFKETKLEKYSKDLDEFYKLFKDIEYRNIKIDNKIYSKYYKKAEKIKKDLNKYINKEIKKKDIFEL